MRSDTLSHTMGRVGILFWFYRDLPVCRNRLEILRRENPDVPVFGLYGGDLRNAPQFEDALRPLLDDFWAFDRPESSKWKWLHGDLMLAAWYEARGCELDWDHVFVAQWDLLVLQPLAALLPPLAPDELLLSTVLPVSAVEPAWVWSRGGHEADYRRFVDEITAQFGPVEPLSCVFVIACLPRHLLAAYATLHDPEAGYVEYRLPTLASAIGLRFVDDERFSAWRPADPRQQAPTRRQRYLNGSRRAVRLPTVLTELTHADGARLFHPYHGLFPVSVPWALRAPGWAGYVAVREGRRVASAQLARLRR
jgi:hypothetical protein